MDNIMYNELVEEALLYGRHYYLLEDSLVEDSIYDALTLRIKKLEENEGIKVRKDSPTQTVGSACFLENTSVKAKHKYSSLLSLANVFNLEELKKWFKGYENNLLVLTPKLDGVNLSCYYKNGFLEKVLTRGNGEVGIDITNLAYFISGIPLTIYCKDSFRVEGEAYCYNFEDIAKDYKNHRNYVAGSLNLKDVTKFKNREINFIAHTLTSDSNFISYTEQLNFLENEGFDSIRYISLSLNNSDDIFSITKKLRRYKYIDGLVYRIQNLGELKEKTAHHPKYAVAYKFPQEKVMTKLIGIDFSMGSFKQVTPVALLEPVNVKGVTIRRASLANMLNVRNLGIYINDYVYLIRAGEVIPQIVGLAKKGKDRIEIKCSTCPACMEKLTEKNGQLFCLNGMCLAGDLKQYFKFTQLLEIKGLGKKTLENLYKAKHIDCFTDILNLDDDTISDYGSSGLKNATKIIENIKQVKNTVSRQKMWGSISIPGVGFSMAKAIGERHKSLINLKKEDLTGISGLGNITAEKIIKWLNENYKELMALEAIFSFKENINKVEEQEGNIVITGTMSKPRYVIVKQLEDLGWNVTNKLSKKTAYLLVGKNPGKKLDEARLKFINILDFETERHILNLA